MYGRAADINGSNPCRGADHQIAFLFLALLNDETSEERLTCTSVSRNEDVMSCLKGFIHLLLRRCKIVYFNFFHIDICYYN